MNVEKINIGNGLMFCNQKFGSYCANEGITRNRTVRLTPQQNRLVEKINRTLIEKVKCMLIQSKFPQSIGRNLMTSTYPVNLSPSLTIGFKTPLKCGLVN